MTDEPSRLNRLLVFLEYDPGNLLLRLDAVREALASGAWDTARQLLYSGLGVHQDAAQLQELRYHLALALLMQGRYQDALAQLNAPQLDEGPSVRVLRARCLHHLGRPAEAIAA